MGGLCAEGVQVGGLCTDGDPEAWAVVAWASLSLSSEGTLWSGLSAPGRHRPAWLTSARHVDERNERT